jgi:DNA adenine methylase
VAEALKPPFTYFGGKLSLAERIVSLLPPHEHYVEPFAGSLSVLLAKVPSPMETVNDLDGNLMNFWRVLRDRPGELQRACALTPHSRAEYLACYEPAADDLERARRVWVNLTQGRGGQMKRTGWRFYQDPRGSHSSMPEYLAAYTGRIAPAAQRLRNVSLECNDALDVIRDYGRHPGTLIYADPPYLGSLRSLNKGRCRGPDYDHELRSDEEHGELLETLLGCRSAVVLSGYASELYDGLLTTWSRREIATQTGNGGSVRVRTEVLWSNRPFPQGSLFDHLEAS